MPRGEQEPRESGENQPRRRLRDILKREKTEKPRVGSEEWRNNLPGTGLLEVEMDGKSTYFVETGGPSGGSALRPPEGGKTLFELTPEEIEGRRDVMRKLMGTTEENSHNKGEAK